MKRPSNLDSLSFERISEVRIDIPPKKKIGRKPSFLEVLDRNDSFGLFTISALFYWLVGPPSEKPHGLPFSSIF